MSGPETHAPRPSWVQAKPARFALALLTKLRKARGANRDEPRNARRRRITSALTRRSVPSRTVRVHGPRRHAPRVMRIVGQTGTILQFFSQTARGDCSRQVGFDQARPSAALAGTLGLDHTLRKPGVIVAVHARALPHLVPSANADSSVPRAGHRSRGRTPLGAACIPARVASNWAYTSVRSRLSRGVQRWLTRVGCSRSSWWLSNNAVKPSHFAVSRRVPGTRRATARARLTASVIRTKREMMNTGRAGNSESTALRVSAGSPRSAAESAASQARTVCIGATHQAAECPRCKPRRAAKRAEAAYNKRMNASVQAVTSRAGARSAPARPARYAHRSADKKHDRREA